jgi:hypothetical protein
MEVITNGVNTSKSCDCIWCGGKDTMKAGGNTYLGAGTNSFSLWCSECGSLVHNAVNHDKKLDGVKKIQYTYKDKSSDKVTDVKALDTLECIWCGGKMKRHIESTRLGGNDVNEFTLLCPDCGAVSHHAYHPTKKIDGFSLEYKMTYPDIKPEGGGEYWAPRGIGYDLSGFVKSKEAGERLLELVKTVLDKPKPASWLDYRESEPGWIQFKFQESEFDLNKLYGLCSDTNIITIDILKQCKSLKIHNCPYNVNIKDCLLPTAKSDTDICDCGNKETCAKYKRFG